MCLCCLLEIEVVLLGPPSLWSKASLSDLAVAVLIPPKAVKLTEVHVGWDPARLIWLRRLAASLAEQAAVP